MASVGLSRMSTVLSTERSTASWAIARIRKCFVSESLHLGNEGSALAVLEVCLNVARETIAALPALELLVAVRARDYEREGLGVSGEIWS